MFGGILLDEARAKLGAILEQRTRGKTNGVRPLDTERRMRSYCSIGGFGLLIGTSCVAVANISGAYSIGWVAGEPVMGWAWSMSPILNIILFALVIILVVWLQRRVRNERNQLQAMVDNVPGIVYRCLPYHPWTMLFISDETDAILGYPACDYLGKNPLRNFGDSMHPEDTGPTSEIIDRAIAEKSQYVVEYRVIDAQGAVHWVFAKGQATYNNVGEAIFLDGAIFDITDRKRMESTLAAERRKAEVASHAKSDFLANMSHEIRTPMNAVLGFAQILKHKETNPEKMHFINSINAAGRSLLSLINDILDLTKIEAGKLEMSLSAVSLGRLCQEMQTTFEQKAKEKGLALTVEVDDLVPDRLWLDELRVRQVLINLIGNAVKFTEQGEVRLKVTYLHEVEEGDQQVDLLVSVTDTGIGILPEDCARIFDMFEQVHGAGGTGLGLSISKRVVELMGGCVWVESSLGKGSCFQVFLPNVEVCVGEKTDVTPIELAHVEASGSATILVVDDIDYNREIISTYLEDEPFTILLAENGKQALELARKHHPDLILLDMKMPVMDGYEAAAIMKADPALSRIPVIAITASALKQDEERISQLCNEYLRKPVSAEELINVVRKYLFSSSEINPSKSRDVSSVPLSSSPSSRYNRSILVAEDNEINQELACELLKDAGAEVTVANNGREAVEAIRQGKFDLVLMDLQMPVRDGLEATREIRTFNTSIPVLAMSADPWADIRKDCEAAGMNGGVSKPIDPQEIHRWLNRLDR